jgi:hypothetical protein
LAGFEVCGKIAHLFGDSQPSAVLDRSRRFFFFLQRVEGEDICLEGDVLDHLDDFSEFRRRR